MSSIFCMPAVCWLINDDAPIFRSIRLSFLATQVVGFVLFLGRCQIEIVFQILVNKLGRPLVAEFDGVSYILPIEDPSDLLWHHSSQLRGGTLCT